MPLSPFPKQIGPSQVSLLSVVSFAVESLAVASLATANFLAEVDFARSFGSAPDFLPPSLSLEASSPDERFFLDSHIVYPFRENSCPVLSSCHLDRLSNSRNNAARRRVRN